MSEEDLKLIYDVERETPRASPSLTPYPDCSLVASLHFSISPFQPTALFTSVSFLPPPCLTPSPLAHSLPFSAAAFLPSALPFFSSFALLPSRRASSSIPHHLPQWNSFDFYQCNVTSYEYRNVRLTSLCAPRRFSTRSSHWDDGSGPRGEKWKECFVTMPPFALFVCSLRCFAPVWSRGFVFNRHLLVNIFCATQHSRVLSDELWTPRCSLALFSVLWLSAASFLPHHNVFYCVTYKFLNHIAYSRQMAGRCIRAS